MGNKSIERVDEASCTGCGLCSVTCPQKCIIMEENEEGFRFPKVNSEFCLNCGLCLNLCPSGEVSKKLYKKNERRYFCGIILDEDILIKSSSGGVFGLLAEHILAAGGYVCGCVYNENVEAVHIVSNKKEDIERMYGSKYVQSRAEQTYPEVAALLEEGKIVMYTGTACQIAAMRLYLNKDYTNLFLVEILCHGVPSTGFFRLYKNYLQKKLGGNIKDIRFRDKEKGGWGSEHRTNIVFEKNGLLREYHPILPSYFSAFFYGLSLRESCYNCRFATRERISDLTIGDFWGSWQKYRKRFNEGISVICVNSIEGDYLLNSVKNKFSMLEQLAEDDAVTSNQNFTHPVQRPIERTSYYRVGLKKGYKGIWKRTYFTKTYRRKTFSSIYGAFIPAKFRFLVSRLLRK